MASSSRPAETGTVQQPRQELERGRSRTSRRGSFAGSEVTRTPLTRRSRSQSLSRITRDQEPTFENTVSTSSLTERRASFRSQSSILQDRERMKTDHDVAVNTIYKQLNKLVNVDDNETETRTKIAAFLNKMKVDIDPKTIQNTNGETILFKVIHHYCDACHTQTSELKRQKKLIDALLFLGFDFFSPNNEGGNILQCFLSSPHFEQSRKILQNLAVEICNIAKSNNRAFIDHLLPAQEGQKRETLLTVQVRQCEPEKVSFLIACGATLDTPNSEEETPLYLSTQLNQSDNTRVKDQKFAITKSLLEHKARLELKPSSAVQTTLHRILDHSPQKALALLNIMIKEEEGEKRFINLPAAESQAFTNAQDRRGYTALMQVCSKPHTEERATLISTLIAMGADTSITSHDSHHQQQALTLALENQYPQAVITQLLKAGADATHATLSGKTPLRLACAGYQKDIALELIQHGADINEIDSDGLTALWRALTRASIKRLEFLLTLTPDVNFLVARKGYQESPLEFVLVRAHEAPSDPDIAKNTQTQTKDVWMHIAHKLLEAGALLTAPGATSTIPQLLLKLEDQSLLKLCAPDAEKQSSDWNVVGADRKHSFLTWLLTLIYESKDDSETVQYKKLFKTIVQQGTALDTRVGPDAKSPLMIAAEQNDAEHVLLLCRAPDQLMPCKKQACINQTDSHGNTALHRACMAGTADKDILTTLSHLITNRADINITNNDGRLALFYAIENNNIGAIKLLTRQSTLSLEAAKAIATSDIKQRIELLHKSTPQGSELITVLREAHKNANDVIAADRWSQAERKHEERKVEQENQRLIAEMQQDTQKEKDVLAQEVTQQRKKIQQFEELTKKMEIQSQQLEQQIAETRSQLTERTTTEKETKEHLAELLARFDQERSQQESYQNQPIEAKRQLAEAQNTITILSETSSASQPNETESPEVSAPAMPVVQSGQDTADDEFTIDIALGSAKIPEKVRFRFSTDTTELSEPTEILLSTQPGVAITETIESVDSATSAQPITREVASGMGQQPLTQTTQMMEHEIARLKQEITDIEFQQQTVAADTGTLEMQQQTINELTQQLAAAEAQLHTLQDALLSQEQQPSAEAASTATAHAVAQTAPSEDSTMRAILIEKVTEFVERIKTASESREPLSFLEPGKMFKAAAAGIDEATESTLTRLFHIFTSSSRTQPGAAGGLPSLAILEREEDESATDSAAMSEQHRTAMLNRKPAVMTEKATIMDQQKEVVSTQSDPELHMYSSSESRIKSASSEDLQHPRPITFLDEFADPRAFPVERQETTSPGDPVMIVTQRRSDSDIVAKIPPVRTRLDCLDLTEAIPNQIANMLSTGVSFTRALDASKTAKRRVSDEESSELLEEAAALSETGESGRKSPYTTTIPGMSPTMLSQSDLTWDDSNGETEPSDTVHRGASVSTKQLERVLDLSDILRQLSSSESGSDGSSGSERDTSMSVEERTLEESIILSEIPESPANEGAVADLSQMQESEVILEAEIDGERVTLRVVADDENGETEL